MSFFKFFMHKSPAGKAWLLALAIRLLPKEI